MYSILARHETDSKGLSKHKTCAYQLYNLDQSEITYKVQENMKNMCLDINKSSDVELHNIFLFHQHAYVQAVHINKVYIYKSCIG